MSNAAKKIEAVQGQQEKIKKNKNTLDDIKKRKLDEIFIGVTGPIGSGTSLVSESLSDCFKSQGYEVNIIKVSKLISEFNSKGFSQIAKDSSKFERIKELQKKGNELRQKISPYIIAKLICKQIAEIRKGKYGDQYHENFHSDRLVFIIDSLKNPNEIQFLQEIYKSDFYLIGVLTTESICETRALDKGLSNTEFREVFEADSGTDQDKLGQQVRDSVQLSDIFIRNDVTSLGDLKIKINRFIDLVLKNKVITPTVHETAMYHAYITGAKSACLSRQVGAAVTDENGNIISTGCNDVPKAFGGLYTIEDSIDYRCFNKGGECFNDKYKNNIYDELFSAFGSGKNKQEFIEKVKKSRVKDLIEFSRAVHAEMDAIIKVAIRGSGTLRNGLLYCTTFPCHNCARHIVAAGISTVYYIEPYPKSLALKLHEDSISQDPKSGDSKVLFLSYEGVSPKKYSMLFARGSLKEDGKLNIASSGHFSNSEKLPFDRFYELELKVIKDLGEKLADD